MMKKKMTPAPKGQTLKGNAAGYNMTRQQARNMSKGKSQSEYMLDVEDDKMSRKTGSMSKDRAMIGMSEYDSKLGRKTEFGKAADAIRSTAKRSSNKMAPQYSPASPKGQTLKGSMKKTEMPASRKITVVATYKKKK
jgi:hypothetical protein